METKVSKDATQLEVIKKDLDDAGGRFGNLYQRLKVIGNKICSTPDTEEALKENIKDSPGHVTDLRSFASGFHKLAGNFEDVISKIEKYI